MGDVTEILAQREQQYGDYRDVAKASQEIKKVIRREPNYYDLPNDARESLDMICSKIARIICGNYENIDHWLDIEGYARLMRNILERKNG
tara:strand:- start:50 stop:319 length:270 start_codon:yes stop_codon:yes gene_type:complete